jgi:hypothetical protein
MRKLAKEIFTIISYEYGKEKILKRISDPFWFQALGCTLGYDWHSSGVTTVVTYVLKKAILPEEHNIGICGGKGKNSLNTPLEIEIVGKKFGLSNEEIEKLKYSSKISAKVDNTAVQAGYHLYHHVFFMTNDGEWAVIQQGMCPEDRTARRYHWLSYKINNFIIEPHNAIVGNVRKKIVLNMTAKKSEGCRKTSLDIVKDKSRIMRRLMTNRSLFQKSLVEWMPKTKETSLKRLQNNFLVMPRKINWKALDEVYEFQPQNYEELIAFKGIGPATVRGLALVAELIYGEKPSWKDPVKYSYAYGGKDGVPYPVNRKAMDESIHILKQAIQESKIGKKEKMQSLQRLRQFVGNA